MISQSYLILISVIGFIFGIAVGVAGALFALSRDESMVKLEPDQMIINRAMKGHVMVQVTTDVLRKFIMDKDISPDVQEARSLYGDNKYKSDIKTEDLK